MAASKDSLLDLERRRAQLEKTVADLRKSLQHWQIWEAEYEGLKEEISALGENPPTQGLDEIGKDFGGVLLNENEIKSLLEDRNGQKRDAAQILSLLSRRIEYVQENVKVSNKRLLATEDKLSAFDIVIHPEARTEDGLPLTEIIEELDDDGNVISSLISTPVEAASQVIDTLRKAGVKDLPEPQQEAGPVFLSSKVSSASSSAPLSSVTNGRSIQPAKRILSADKTEAKRSAPNESLSTQGPKPSAPRQKKSVSFAADTKKADSTGPNTTSFTGQKSPAPYSINALRNKHLIGRHSVPIDPETADEAFSPPVITINESPEDAALRRQMLQYNLEEVGAIVAEMDLEEKDSSEDFSEDPDDDHGSTTDEEEDQFGRTINRLVDDDYRQQMLELEQKLNAKMLVNVGPNPEIPDPATLDHKEGDEDSVSNKTPFSVAKTDDERGNGKKGVPSSQNLDILKRPQLTPPGGEPFVPLDKAIRPISEAVVERAELSRASGTSANTHKKVSKFKTARNTAPPHGVQDHKGPINTSNAIANGPRVYGGSPLPLKAASKPRQKTAPIPTTYETEARSRKVPEGPPGKTHAEVLIERPAPQIEEIVEPNEFDPALMQQELAVEYHRMRNRMIQRNGGFVQAEEESEQIPLSEDGDGGGGGRRISKFMAARLGGLGK